MRQLLVQVPRGHGQTVLDVARKYEGANLVRFEAHGSEGALDAVFVHVSNRKVESLLGELQALPNLHVTLIPRGVMPLQPPPTEAPHQVTDVTLRSPLEVFLSALQSVGSWTGFLGYAAAAAVVVWIGLFTNTIFLLTAAMLIAPFASPAMNVAMATARGDGQLLLRSLGRYVASLSVTVVLAGVLSLLLRQEVATPLMVDQSQISAIAVLLPLVAGAAGALNLIQSQRSSLVSGAATGMLVAASLAPPAGIVGMGSAIGEWDMAKSGVFVLLLQLVGINLAGALVFRAAGLSARGVRYPRGKPWLFPSALAVTILTLGGMLTSQFWESPEFQRSSRAQHAVAEIQHVIQESDLADMVEANVRFTRADIPGQHTLLGVLYVQRRAEATAPAEEIRHRLTRQLQTHLLQQGFNVTPLFDVSVLEPPPDGK